MEYNDPPAATEFAARVREFVDDVVIPIEREHLGHGPVEPETWAELRDAARDYDVYAPQVPEEYGGHGLDFRESLPAFEEAGRSLLAPGAMRVAAPDEGNMHTLELFGTEAQQDRWLAPLASGEIRSGFSMTEPSPGAGSDPKMIRTTAEQDGDEWIIDGHKWWTTQGSEADVLIVMARTDQDAHPYEGCSLFLVPADADGVEVVRDVPHVGGGLVGASHAEIKYHDVRVPEDALLGELNEGFNHAQARLGPARLTHCMRFAGMADRALDVATAYASDRDAFDSKLSEKQHTRFTVADGHIRLHAARTMIRDAADRVAAGDQARIPVAMAKVFTANVTQDVIDGALQICGGAGISRDLPLANFYENVRQFRIIDGADEVHKRVVARDAFRDVDEAELENLPRFGE